MNNGNLTKWSPIWSVIDTNDYQNRTTAKRESDFINHEYD